MVFQGGIASPSPFLGKLFGYHVRVSCSIFISSHAYRFLASTFA